MAKIFSKLAKPLKDVAKEGSVTLENAKETVLNIGDNIIKMITIAQGRTNSIPVRARLPSRGERLVLFLITDAGLLIYGPPGMAGIDHDLNTNHNLINLC
jgi:hypothetical protein